MFLCELEIKQKVPISGVEKYRWGAASNNQTNGQKEVKRNGTLDLANLRAKIPPEWLMPCFQGTSLKIQRFEDDLDTMNV